MPLPFKAIKEGTINIETSKDRLSIEVTTHCNRSCRHCFVHATPIKKTIPIDMVKSMITEGYQAGFRRLHITGGEPLLWKNLFCALDFALESGYQQVLLNTNGSLLSKQTIRRLSKYAGLTLTVSLEGTQAYHHLLRQVDDYQHVHSTIEKTLETGLNLIIFTTVGKSLLKDLSRFAVALYGRFPTIRHLSFIQLIRPTKEIFDLENELLEPSDFIKLVQIVSLLNLYGHKTEILNNPLAVVVSKRLNLPLIPRVPSLEREGHVIIKADRRIGFAHSMRKSFGEYESGMLKKVLCSHEFKSAVSPNDTICPSCKYSKTCMENGMLRPSEWFRDMQPEIPYCKRVMNMVDKGSY